VTGTVEYQVNGCIFRKIIWGLHAVGSDFEQQLNRVKATAGILGAIGRCGFPDMGAWFLRDRVEQST